MLWTCSISVFNENEKMFTPYYLLKNQGNDVVVPDQSDLNEYEKGTMIWQAFKLNYLAKLMRPEAEQWMKKVATKSVLEDVVLVSDEEQTKKCYRVFLAEMIVNIFSGHMKITYNGEVIGK